MENDKKNMRPDTPPIPDYTGQQRDRTLPVHFIPTPDGSVTMFFDSEFKVAVASPLVARLLRLPEAYWTTVTSLVIAQIVVGYGARNARRVNRRQGGEFE